MIAATTRLTDEEELTRVSYLGDTIPAWAVIHTDPDYWRDEFDLFRAYLPPGKVYEVGIGAGCEAELFVQHGYDYTGVDYSMDMIKLAAARVPNTRFIHASIYDLDFPGERFDGFWLADVLIHIPKSRIQKALASVCRPLHKGAVGFISLKEGVGEHVVNGMDQHTNESRPRFFAFYQAKEFVHILRTQGFDILWWRRFAPGSHPIREHSTPWLCFLVKMR